MNFADILIIAAVAVLVVLAWRTAHKKGSCSCGSGGCSGHCSACSACCGKNKDSPVKK